MFRWSRSLQAQGLAQKVKDDENSRKGRDAQQNAGNQREDRKQYNDGPRNRFPLNALKLQEAVVGWRLIWSHVVDNLRLRRCRRRRRVRRRARSRGGISRGVCRSRGRRRTTRRRTGRSRGRHQGSHRRVDAVRGRSTVARCRRRVLRQQRRRLIRWRLISGWNRSGILGRSRGHLCHRRRGQRQ